MNHLRRLGSSMSISIPADDDGFTGRECPQADCEGYFKIELGTGLKGVGIPCHCPYCDHTAGHDQFWTKAQIEYAKSVAMRKITDAFHKDLKKLEFNHKPKGAFGIGISMKVSPSRLTPIHKFREKKLETEIVCDSCTLRYAVYGVFAFCPDCGQHNSSQIFDKNLELVEKMLGLAAKADDKDVSERLIENALEDCISAFDGFGREICRVHAEKAINPIRAEKISFQDLRGAQKKLSALFDIDLSDGITAQEWEEVTRGFQKRNLLSHKMGVVDEAYIRKTDDIDAVVGRKITLASSDVREVARIVGKLKKVKMQTRGRQIIVLVRLDLGGAPHRNPDGEEIPVPHLHVYREGYGDKWAMPVPTDQFRAVPDVWMTFEDFMRFCNITRPPNVKQELLT